MESESSKFNSVKCTQTQVYTAELKQARNLLHVGTIDVLGTFYLNFKYIGIFVSTHFLFFFTGFLPLLRN